MPSPKSHRTCQIETHRRESVSENSSPFHGSNTVPAAKMRRPKTLPDLLSYRNHTGAVPEAVPRQPPKVLLKVTMLGSLVPVQVLMRPESTVGDLIAAVVCQYVKEGRRPILPTAKPSGFDLHYSQFSLESLDREENLAELGSRNFFLCPRKDSSVSVEGGVTTPFVSCAKEVEKVSEGGGGGGGFGWFKLMHFML